MNSAKAWKIPWAACSTFSAMDSLGAADGLDAFNLGNTLDGIYGNTGGHQGEHRRHE